MATYPLATLGPTISDAGISIPSFNDVYQSLIASYKAIYGSDIYVAPDSQDGQWIATIAQGITDCNLACVATFNGYSPTYASGAALSAEVKINGLERLSSSKSTVNVAIGGQVGSIITAGVISDASGNKWDLPATVTIPIAGTITVTATAQQTGNIQAAANTVNQIVTVQRGWQTVNNPGAAVAGAPVEKDPALRLRQQDSVAIPSQTVLTGILGAIKNLAGVTAARPYENDTGSTDANGIPAGNIALVVQGGDATQIAQTLLLKKTGGVPTYGNTTVNVNDANGNAHAIQFSVPTAQRITVAIQLHGFANYTVLIGDQIKAAVAAYINSLGIGQKVYIVRLQVPAQLNGSSDSLNYEIVSIAAAIYPTTPATTDIAIAFNQIAHCDVSDVSIATV